MIYLILVIIVLTLGWWALTTKPKNYPPGPYRWPIIGNMLEFKRANLRTHQVIAGLSSRYGNLVGMYLADKPLVIVAGLHEIRDVLSRPECQARPPHEINIYENNINGILFTDGELWREHRNFTVRHLKDLGMGKREMETLILEEVVDMLEDAKRMAGKDYQTPVPTMELINSIGPNVIFHMMAGRRFKRGNPQLKYLLKMIRDLSEFVDSSGGIIDAFPFLLRYAQWMTPYVKRKALKGAVINFLQDCIDEHEANFKGEHFDYIDYYLAEIKKEVPNPVFSRRQLVGVCTDLFLAGSETSTGALSFALIHMIREPKVQAKVHAELDEVLGRGKLPTTDNRQSLPYVNATLLEALRIGSVAPLALPHAVNQDVQIGPYLIPNGSRIVINLNSMHHSKEIWGDPEAFRPERFLDDNGQVIVHEALLPFGMGKRACPGESMARTSLFLMFTALLQNFELSIPDGEPTPSCQPLGALTLATQPFNMKLTPRI